MYRIRRAARLQDRPDNPGPAVLRFYRRLLPRRHRASRRVFRIRLRRSRASIAYGRPTPTTRRTETAAARSPAAATADALPDDESRRSAGPTPWRVNWQCSRPPAALRLDQVLA